MKNQDWFEMKDVRKRWLDKSVWVPLRSSNTINETGKYGYLGYQEEFYGVGTLCVPVDQLDDAKVLDWHEIGIGYDQRSWVDNDGAYYSAETYKHYSGKISGVNLVLSQYYDSGETAEWHLNQDFVIALGLKREDDTWACPNEGYDIVARLTRDNEGNACLLEVKMEYLRDYLCARNMMLRVVSYRSRKEVVSDTKHINWENGEKNEDIGEDRWEGRVIPIHEGGNPYGTKTRVFHVGRTDVDPEADVPTIGINDQFSSKSWTVKGTGRKLFLIEGELWRNEWVEPGSNSPRIKGDKLPSTSFFITDASGKKEAAEALVDAGIWLWFSPNVINSLINRRGGSLGWYTKYTGSVSCSPRCGVHFGINKIGLINVYAKDIALLPEWQQQIWSGFNIGPNGGVSEELLSSQAKAVPADTQAPEGYIEKSLITADEAFKNKFGEHLFYEHKDKSEIIKQTHRFRVINQAGIFSLAKDLARLTADSINVEALKKNVKLSKDEKVGSLKLLENVLATVVSSEDAHKIMGPLFGVYELRLGDAHLPSKEIEEAFNLVRVNPSDILIEQGRQLIGITVAALYKIADILKLGE